MDAFTATVGEGNRAGVVFDADGLTPAQMQDIAAFANVSETAFMINAGAGPLNEGGEYDVHVRYFTPTSEVPICGHATIASHYLRVKRDGISNGTVLSKTGVGILPVDIQKIGDDIKIIMTQGTPEIGEILNEPHVDEALKALRITRGEIHHGLPVQFVSTGHGKVIIPIKELSTLHRLTPDFGSLKALTRKIGHTGYFALVISGDQDEYQTHGRMFAPSIGINEDPVTGNGNGPAGLYLSHHNVFRFDDEYSYLGKQGEAMGKPGVIEVRIFKENGVAAKVQVAGSAVEAGILQYSL